MLQNSDLMDSLKKVISTVSQEIIEKQYALQPEFARYGERGFYQSLEDARYNLEYLFTAVSLESKAIFEAYLLWANTLFKNIGLPTKSLENFYLITKGVINEKSKSFIIDSSAVQKISEYIDFGIEVLNRSVSEQNSFIRMDNPYIQELLQYRDFLLASDKNSAVKLVTGILNRNVEIKDIYKYIFQPFQLELGRLWHNSKISVAQEHYATAATQLIMSLLYEKIFSTPKNDRTLIGTCVGGELHELGIRMVCDYLECCGWNTYYLGANMPENAVLQMVREKNPDVVAISCTMTFNIPKVISLIDKLKNENIKAPVMVGGYPFNIDGELWKKVGADAFSKDFEEAYVITEQLVRGGEQNDAV